MLLEVVQFRPRSLSVELFQAGGVRVQQVPIGERLKTFKPLNQAVLVELERAAGGSQPVQEVREGQRLAVRRGAMPVVRNGKRKNTVGKRLLRSANEAQHPVRFL